VGTILKYQSVETILKYHTANNSKIPHCCEQF
jgi:hypothetical protein